MDTPVFRSLRIAPTTQQGGTQTIQQSIYLSHDNPCGANLLIFQRMGLTGIRYIDLKRYIDTILRSSQMTALFELMKESGTAYINNPRNSKIRREYLYNIQQWAQASILNLPVPVRYYPGYRFRINVYDAGGTVLYDSFYPAVTVVYTYSTYTADTSITSPGATGIPPGKIVWNNATQANAKKVYISTTTSDGYDITDYLKLLNAGQSFNISLFANTNTKFQQWIAKSAPVFFTNYVSIELTKTLAVYTEMANNDILSFRFIPSDIAWHLTLSDDGVNYDSRYLSVLPSNPYDNIFRTPVYKISTNYAQVPFCNNFPQDGANYVGNVSLIFSNFSVNQGGVPETTMATASLLVDSANTRSFGIPKYGFSARTNLSGFGGITYNCAHYIDIYTVSTDGSQPSLIESIFFRLSLEEDLNAVFAPIVNSIDSDNDYDPSLAHELVNQLMSYVKEQDYDAMLGMLPALHELTSLKAGDNEEVEETGDEEPIDAIPVIEEE